MFGLAILEASEDKVHYMKTMNSKHNPISKVLDLFVL